MLKTILTSLRSADLRKKLAFTAFILLVYRFGSYVPVPGVDLDALQTAIDERGSRLLDFLNLFAGGALTRFAVFALGIMPYITASIILQLMTVVIPSAKTAKRVRAPPANRFRKSSRRLPRWSIAFWRASRSMPGTGTYDPNR